MANTFLGNNRRHTILVAVVVLYFAAGSRRCPEKTRANIRICMLITNMQQKFGYDVFGVPYE